MNGVVASLLRDPKLIEYDIVAIQEPWTNPYCYTTHNPVRDSFVLYYMPTREDNVWGSISERARTCLFVNRRIHPNSISFLPAYSMRDIYSTKDDQHTTVVRIHSVYNALGGDGDQPQPALSTLDVALNCEGTFRNPKDPNKRVESIIVGDFNIHHPAWGGESVNADARSNTLMELIDDYGLTQHVPVGSQTYLPMISAHRPSTLDLAFTTQGLKDRVIKCGIRDDMDHGSDHMPIENVVDVSLREREETRDFDYKKTNIPNFMPEVRTHMYGKTRQLYPRSINTYTGHLLDAVEEALELHTPKKKPASSRSRAGFNVECKESVRKGISLRRKYKKVISFLDETYDTRAKKIRSPEAKKIRSKAKQATKDKKALFKRTLRDEHRDLRKPGDRDYAIPKSYSTQLFG